MTVRKVDYEHGTYVTTRELALILACVSDALSYEDRIETEQGVWHKLPRKEMWRFERDQRTRTRRVANPR